MANKHVQYNYPVVELYKISTSKPNENPVHLQQYCMNITITYDLYLYFYFTDKQPRGNYMCTTPSTYKKYYMLTFVSGVF